MFQDPLPNQESLSGKGLPGGPDGGAGMGREGFVFTGLVRRDLNWISEARLKFENNLRQKLESRHHRRYQLQV